MADRPVLTIAPTPTERIVATLRERGPLRLGQLHGIIRHRGMVGALVALKQAGKVERRDDGRYHLVQDREHGGVTGGR